MQEPILSLSASSATDPGSTLNPSLSCQAEPAAFLPAVTSPVVRYYRWDQRVAVTQTGCVGGRERQNVPTVKSATQLHFLEPPNPPPRKNVQIICNPEMRGKANRVARRRRRVCKTQGLLQTFLSDVERVIGGVNACNRVAIHPSVVECQCTEWR